MSLTDIPHLNAVHLAPHVRACQVRDQVVLLDLARNRYLGIGATQSHALSQVVKGWPASAHSPPVTSVSRVDRILEPLIEKGLVVTSASQATLRSEPVRAAVASLDARDVRVTHRLGPRVLLRFVRATISAAVRLRCFTLESTVNHVAAMHRTDSGLRKPSSGAPSAAQLRESVATFDTLRPLVFTSRDRCLYDSLALVAFLAYEGVSAAWVIGVRTNPFGAHSWVQFGDLVLNDLHENVRGFTPILAV